MPESFDFAKELFFAAEILVERRRAVFNLISEGADGELFDSVPLDEFQTLLKDRCLDVGMA